MKLSCPRNNCGDAVIDIASSDFTALEVEAGANCSYLVQNTASQSLSLDAVGIQMFAGEPLDAISGPLESSKFYILASEKTTVRLSKTEPSVPEAETTED